VIAGHKGHEDGQASSLISRLLRLLPTENLQSQLPNANINTAVPHVVVEDMIWAFMLPNKLIC